MKHQSVKHVKFPQGTKWFLASHFDDLEDFALFVFCLQVANVLVSPRVLQKLLQVCPDAVRVGGEAGSDSDVFGSQGWEQ